MINFIDHQGFIIVQINGWYHVYEPIALAYVGGDREPPEELFFDKFETLPEAEKYITATIKATSIAIEQERQGNYAPHD